MNPKYRRRRFGGIVGAGLWALACGGLIVAQPEPNGGRDTHEWVTKELAAPRVSFHKFRSGVLGKEVSYHLYAPAAYDEQEARLPVVYWLHGTGGGLAGIPTLARLFDNAITGGKAPPFLVVFVNGLPGGMYVDWKDGSTPVETVVIEELIPHIDGAHRTRASREGRLIDGFSMGGYGAARLGFSRPELFRGVSIVGAGPMQPELIEAPRAGRQRAREVLERVYAGDQDYFKRVSPRAIAERNAESLAGDLFVRVVIGERDETFPANRAFHEHLAALGIPHQWRVVAGVGHDARRIMTTLGDEWWEFYARVFDTGCVVNAERGGARSTAE